MQIEVDGHGPLVPRLDAVGGAQPARVRRRDPRRGGRDDYDARDGFLDDPFLGPRHPHGLVGQARHAERLRRARAVHVPLRPSPDRRRDPRAGAGRRRGARRRRRRPRGRARRRRAGPDLRRADLAGLRAGQPADLPGLGDARGPSRRSRAAVATYDRVVAPHVAPTTTEQGGGLRREPRVDRWIFSTDGVGFPVAADQTAHRRAPTGSVGRCRAVHAPGDVRLRARASSRTPTRSASASTRASSRTRSPSWPASRAPTPDPEPAQRSMPASVRRMRSNSASWTAAVGGEHVGDAPAQVERTAVEVLAATAGLGDHERPGGDVPRVGRVALVERVEATGCHVGEAQRRAAEQACTSRVQVERLDASSVGSDLRRGRRTGARSRSGPARGRVRRGRRAARRRARPLRHGSR